MLSKTINDLGCGGTLTQSSAFIDSPGYPSTYPPDVDCVWRINAPAGDTVLVSFLAVNMSSNCATDYIEVRDGNSNNASLIGKYCGTTVPASFSSTGSNLYINLRTSANGIGSGFRLSYVLGTHFYIKYYPIRYYFTKFSICHIGLTMKFLNWTTLVDKICFNYYFTITVLISIPNVYFIYYRCIYLNITIII